jgi:hypothetical protein
MAIMLPVVSVLSTARIRGKLTRGIDLHEPESLGVDRRVACGVNQLKAKFQVLWPEPVGGGRGSRDSETTSEVEEPEHMGQKFYAGFRQFIVVANDEGHCTCV